MASYKFCRHRHLYVCLFGFILQHFIFFKCTKCFIFFRTIQIFIWMVLIAHKPLNIDTMTMLLTKFYLGTSQSVVYLFFLLQIFNFSWEVLRKLEEKGCIYHFKVKTGNKTTIRMCQTFYCDKALHNLSIM